ncbi:MAG: competence/damage-inducible protein A [Gammaproteobacteria bacterium]|nr:competence/damage-inducible protein A [Gammaproteobacteria bacterium]
MHDTITPDRECGLIIIGDEILFGKRRDRHLEHFRGTLGERGLLLSRCWLLPDSPKVLIRHLRLSFEDPYPVFVCGGIGATPDDRTRACAAEAANIPLKRHPEAALLIEERFGSEAYPSRILMADLPSGCELIPNPVSRIPGFSVKEHHFLPGFPEMAWPMAEWVLAHRYPRVAGLLEERSLKVLNTPESSLVPIMEALSGRFTSVSIFSLPRIGENRYIELGFRGHDGCEQAMEALRDELRRRNIPFEEDGPH